MSDNSMDNGGLPIHPALRKMEQWLKLGTGLILILTLAMLLMMVFIVLKNSRDQNVGLMLLAVTVPVFLVLFASVYFLKRFVLNKLRKASRVMYTSPPVQMMGRSLKVSDLNGAYMELRKMDASMDSPPWGVAVVAASKKSPLPKKEAFEVKTYVDESSSDGFLVLELGDRVMWGTLTTPETRKKSWRNMKRLFIIMLIFFFFILSALTVVQYFAINKAKERLALAVESLAWPRAQGVITSSVVKDVRIKRGKGSAPGFKADISYDYYVLGRRHSGDRLFFGYSASRDRKWAANWVKAYPPGAKILVSYKPGDPGVSVVEPGHVEECEVKVRKAWLTMAAPAIMGAVLLLTFVIILAVTRRRWRKAFEGD